MKIDEIFFNKEKKAQRQAFKSGEKTLRLTFDNLKKEFAQYLGSQGKSKWGQATTQDLIDFLDDKNVDTRDLDPNIKMNRNAIFKKLKNVSMLAIRGKGSKSKAEPEPMLTFKSTRSEPTPVFKSTRSEPVPTFKSSRS
jgi:hypothetical protein